MVNIKGALSSLPSKPALFIAPGIICVVLGLHYSQVYNTCQKQTRLRAQLMDKIGAAAGRSQFRLDQAIPFNWNIVRITQGYKPEKHAINCPFGWGWAEEKRRELADASQITILGFFMGNLFRGFVELDGGKIHFVGTEKPIGIGNAVFDVDKSQAGGPVVLRRVAERLDSSS